MPLAYDRDVLLGPVLIALLVALLVCYLQQNAKASRAIRFGRVQIRALRIRITVAHAQALRGCSISEKPLVVSVRIARSNRCKSSRFAGLEDCRAHLKRGPNARVRGVIGWLLRSAGYLERYLGIGENRRLSVLDIGKMYIRHLAFERRGHQRRLTQRPDIAKGESMQRGLFLLDLEERVPVVEPEIFKGISAVIGLCAIRASEGKQREWRHG